MFTDHHSLTSYQKSKILVKNIICLSEKLPKTRPADITYTQIVRCASSIGANIAEGYGRNNPKEYKQFLGIALGSSFETEYWLEVIQDSFGLTLSDIIELNKEIIKILTVTIRNLSNHPA